MTMNDSIHARAFNLARKNSVRNENDLMQENFMEDDDGDVKMSYGSSGASERFCSSLLKDHLPPDFEMPNECYRFSNVRANLIRRDSKKEDHAVAFAGMDPGSAIKAMSAREQGHPHTAQITRRLTSRSKKTESSWF